MKNQNQIGISESKKETFIFEPVAPHSQSVGIGELLVEIEGIIKRHVVLSEAAATALAVWVAHTYVFELRDTVAYVAIESPEKRCGKTTLLTVLAAMANKPLIASNVTVSALFRAIDACGPTLFIDEADTFLAGNGTMRGVINSGNTWRTAYVLRLSKRKTKSFSQPPLLHGRSPGDLRPGLDERHDSGLERYSCWCPKAIAMIGKVPDTVSDRSIVVSMTRKLVAEKRAPLAELNTLDIKARCARFALDHRDAISRSEKIHGEGLNDRAADTFDPLYVIARLAGEEWERKLHGAALTLASNAQGRGSGMELLRDIHVIFELSGRKRIYTRDLLKYLQQEDFAMRALAMKYAALDEYRLSQLLRPYGVKSFSFRVKMRVGRGYSSEDFRSATARYLSASEVEARIEEVRRDDKLWAEAKEEIDRAWG
ncbi:MAG: DUF3631 domain-containing protein [Limisphaerales bacterium]